MSAKHLFGPIISLIIIVTLTTGCAGKNKPVVTPTQPETAVTADPLQVLKNEFWERYEYFVIDYAKVNFYLTDLGIIETEEKIFQGLSTVEEFNKFTEIFWKIRDLDPRTPENEFKTLIDNRIGDILNEVFLLQGVSFRANDGLKGDLAHVYLLHGAPSFMETLPEGHNYVDLTVWYYVDQSGQTLFRFLFYNKYKGYTVFRKYVQIIDINYLFDPAFSPLREISKGLAITPGELYEMFQELQMNDPRGLFLYALLSFSDFSGITVDEALDAPEPISITAERYRPTILGKSEIPADKEMLFGSRKSFLPITLIRSVDSSGKYRLVLHMRYSDVDWEIQRDPGGDSSKDKIFASFNLRIRFQNRQTREKSEFFSGVSLIDLKSKYDNALPGVLQVIRLGDSRNYIAGNGLETLNEFIDRLEPGTYTVDFSFRDVVTKKALSWAGDITIK